MSARTRVLVTKLGLDGHDRGLRLIARELSQRGVEVVYLGIATRPAEAARAAVQEDVDAIAVSILSGSHLAHLSTLLAELRAQDVDIPVVCGGLIPQADADRLVEMGVSAVSPAGTAVAGAADLVLAAVQGPAVDSDDEA